MDEPNVELKGGPAESDHSADAASDGSEPTAEAAQTGGQTLAWPGMLWSSLLLAPLTAVLLIPLWLCLPASDEWTPPPGMTRIEMAAAYPRVAWMATRNRNDITGFLRSHEGRQGAVFFVQNDMVPDPIMLLADPLFQQRLEQGIAGADLRLRPATPEAFGILSPKLSQRDEAGPIQLRLGDVAYGGILPQPKSLDGKGPIQTVRDLEAFYAPVASLDLIFRDSDFREARTTSELIAGATIVALLKAEARQLTRLIFVQSTLESYSSGPLFPAERWIEVIAETIGRVAPSLRWLDEVYLVATFDPANPAAQPRGQQNQVQQQVPPKGQAITAPEVPRPNLWDRYVANLKLVFAIPLPWQDAADVLSIRSLGQKTEVYQQPANASSNDTKILNPEAVNPAYQTFGRASFVPLAAYLMVLGAVVAWFLRREQPDAPKSGNLVFAWWVTFMFGGLTLVGLTWLSDAILFGFDVTGVDVVDSSLALGTATLAGGFGGFISGQFGYAAARPRGRA